MAYRAALRHAPSSGPQGGDVIMRRSARARRYRIEVKRDGSAVLTIPARGSEREAREFLERQTDWLARARERVGRLPRVEPAWTFGTTILFRGEWTTIARNENDPRAVTLGERSFRLRSLDGDLRPALEAHFKRLASIELVARTWELATVHETPIKRVSIRGQRTRWGSCSRSGTISLNWRLVQAPAWVADYVIVHELVHTRHMNHSDRYWRALAAAFPMWREAEAWLKSNGPALGL